MIGQKNSLAPESTRGLVLQSSPSKIRTYDLVVNSHPLYR